MLGMSSIALASNHVHHKRTKHIEFDLHYVKNTVLGKIIEVQYVPIQERIADILPKSFGVKRFQYLRGKLDVVSLNRLETNVSH